MTCSAGLRKGIISAAIASHVIVWLCSAAVAAEAPATKPPHFAAGVKVGAIQSPAVSEASGLAASRKNKDILWVHNDSGDTARVFAMTTSGTHLGIYNLQGATVTDCEDIAIGPGPKAGKDYVYIGDIGDNNAVRSTIDVYRFEEPVVSADQKPVDASVTGWQKLTLRYPDGARDAESLFVDPRGGDLYIISKREAKSRVYRAAAFRLVSGKVITLSSVAELPWGWATAADVSPAGDGIIVRGYFNASLWTRPSGEDLWKAFQGKEHTIPLAVEPQGEAIAFDANGQGYYTTSEGTNQPIYYYARRPAAPDPGH